MLYFRTDKETGQIGRVDGWSLMKDNLSPKHTARETMERFRLKQAQGPERYGRGVDINDVLCSTLKKIYVYRLSGKKSNYDHYFAKEDGKLDWPLDEKSL